MLTGKQLCDTARAKMPPEEISHHGCGNGMDDLYLKVTPVSKELVDQYEFKCNVTTFTDQITHALWYDIPFAYYLTAEKEET